MLRYPNLENDNAGSSFMAEKTSCNYQTHDIIQVILITKMVLNPCMRVVICNVISLDYVMMSIKFALRPTTNIWLVHLSYYYSRVEGVGSISKFILRPYNVIVALWQSWHLNVAFVILKCGTVAISNNRKYVT